MESCSTSLRRAPRGVRVLVAATTLLIAAYGISVLPGIPGRPGAIGFWETWVASAIYIGAALICLARGVLVAAERVAWLTLAAALAATTAGSVFWGVAFSGDPDPPYVSFADGLWLAFYPLTYAAIVLLVRSRVRHFHRSMWLDGLVSALAVAAVSAAAVFDTLIADTGGEPLIVAVNLAYPIADLLLIVLVVGVFGATGWRPGRAWLLLGAGLAVTALGDAVYLLQAARGTYVEGTWLDWLWLPGVLLMALAAWQPLSERVPSVDDWRALAIPSLSTLIAAGVLAASALGDGHDLAVTLATAAVIASVARTGLTFREVRQLAEARRQALTDDLTGLANRRALLAHLDDAVAAQRPFALLLFDLDRFKELNDTLGHHTGDRLLSLIGPRLAGELGADDVLARLGGDEFAVLHAGAPAAAVTLAERLRDRLDAPFELDGVPVHIEASIGIATPEHAHDTTEVLQHADIAMYHAKRAGTEIEAYRPDRDRRSPNRLARVGELRSGIDRGELVLRYQPKASLSDGRLIGVEALVRWQHPVHGLLGPGEFLPAVEQTGVMRALTRQVIADALADAVARRHRGRPLPVAVNVAAPNLLDPEFPATIAQLLTHAHAVPTDLRLEIPENAVMADAERAHTVLHNLRAIGIGLSIDDFGTGQSSLERLASLPIDELKIDRSFVMALDTDPRRAAIVDAAIALGRRLDLTVVAEGLETHTAWQHLRDLRCDQAQGFFIAEPLTSTELDHFAAAWTAPQPTWHVTLDRPGADLRRMQLAATTPQ